MPSGCVSLLFYLFLLFIYTSLSAGAAIGRAGPRPRPSANELFLFISLRLVGDSLPSPLPPRPPTATARRLAARAINPAKVEMNLSLAFASSPTPPAVHVAPCTEPIAQVRSGGGGSSSSSGRNRGIDSREEVYCRC